MVVGNHDLETNNIVIFHIIKSLYEERRFVRNVDHTCDFDFNPVILISTPEQTIQKIGLATVRGEEPLV